MKSITLLTLLLIAMFQISQSVAISTSLNLKSVPYPKIQIEPNVHIPHLAIKTYLSNRTEIYQHGVFGHSYEFKTLNFQTRTTKGTPRYSDTIHFTLNGKDVFEDRIVRIVDLDRNGNLEFLQVVANETSGARLMLLELDGNQIRIKAQSEAIGKSNRWRNPIGVGDFDGDGTLEIASVRTPHIGGVLEIHKLEGSKLVKTHELAGVSNHDYGSTQQVLGQIVSSQSAPDKIVVRGQKKHQILTVSMANDQLKVLNTFNVAKPSMGKPIIYIGKSPTTKQITYAQRYQDSLSEIDFNSLKLISILVR